MFKLLSDSESELLVGGAAKPLEVRYFEVLEQINATAGDNVGEAESTKPVEILENQPGIVAGILSATPSW